MQSTHLLRVPATVPPPSRQITMALLSLLALSKLAVAAAQEAPVGSSAASHTATVALGPGQFLKGHTDDRTGRRRFLGVPFAEPPTGDLRWRAPQPLSAWSGVKPALTFGNSCYQGTSVQTVGSEVSEDCLYLNVYTPPVTEESKHTLLPVMIFFYGGSWSTGTSTCPVYWGDSFVANSNHSVILVTVNYRLNGFGFLGADAMRDNESDGADHGSTGNWGLLDQRASMRWVQEHAEAFGGDPNSVAIFGESAGAGSVAVHLSSQRSFAAADGPLFHAALLESGSPGTPWNSQNMTYAEAKARHFADVLNCSSATANPTDKVTAEEVACMRTRSTEEVYEARKGLPSSLLTWSPTVDGVELTCAPRDMVAQINANTTTTTTNLRGASSSSSTDAPLTHKLLLATNVTILLGSNGDEGSEFTDLAWDADADEYAAYMLSLFDNDEDYTAKVLAQYPASAYNASGVDGKQPAGHGPFYASSRALGDAVFSCPARATARAWAKANDNNDGNQAGGAYLYFFNHTLQALAVAQAKDPKMQPPPYDQMGVFHGTELGFVFDVSEMLDVGRSGDGGRASPWPLVPRGVEHHRSLGNSGSSDDEDVCDEEALAKAVGAYWTSFGRVLSPLPGTEGGCEKPNWSAFTVGAEKYMYFGSASVELKDGGLKEQKCDFWDANPVPVAAIFGSQTWPGAKNEKAAAWKAGKKAWQPFAEHFFSS